MLRHFIMITMVIPAMTGTLAGVSQVFTPVREFTSCSIEGFSHAGQRVEKRGLMPFRDLKLVVRDTGRCF